MSGGTPAARTAGSRFRRQKNRCSIELAGANPASLLGLGTESTRLLVRSTFALALNRATAGAASAMTGSGGVTATETAFHFEQAGFEAFEASLFGVPNPGSAAERTMMEAFM